MKFEIDYYLEKDGEVVSEVESIVIGNVTSFDEAFRKLCGSIKGIAEDTTCVQWRSFVEIEPSNPVQEFIDWKYKSKV